MESNAAEQPKYKAHSFESANGTIYRWNEHQEAALTLREHEITQLRESISQMPDQTILNDVSGNGVPMGVPIPISEERLSNFLEFIKVVISLREKLNIRVTEHAQERLEEDMLNGVDHPDFRGWMSGDEIHECVCNIHRVDGARLTIDKRSLTEEEKRFYSPIALEVRGKKPSGEEGTLALAFIEETQVRIITLLKSKNS